jgi:cation diffusion facilitator CzcD-associated flavoprotein CzcO
MFSSDYYPAMARENVEIVTGGLREVTANAIVTDTGERREVDTIIFATGFAAHGFVSPMEIYGREDVPLSEAWRDGARAYLGMTVTGFPNLFLVYGPNTNLGSGSIVYMHESQARYITDAVRHLGTRPGALDVRGEVLDAYDEEMQRRASAAQWSTGCQSWYVEESGRNSNNWPGLMREYRRRTRHLDLADYAVLERRREAIASA